MTDEQLKQALQNSLPPVPMHCHQAFASALGSVKEDEPVKRNIFCTVAIAMTILCVTIGAAFGATQLMDSALNNEWQDVAAQPEEADPTANPVDFTPVEEAATPTDLPLQSWELGPVTVTLTESTYYSGVLCQIIDVRMTDGSQAIFMPAGNTVKDPVRIMGGAMPIGITEQMSFLQAARKANVPLYCVTMLSIIETPMRHYDCPKTGTWTADGSLVLASRISANNAAALTDTQLYVRVTPIDTSTGKMESNEGWTFTETLAVESTHTQCTLNFAPEKPVLLHGKYGQVTLVGVHIEMLPSYAYLYTVYDRTEISDPASLPTLLYSTSFTTLQGQAVPNALVEYYDYTDVGSLFITMQTIDLSTAPDGLVLFDVRHMLNTDPIVLHLVDHELAERYTND